MAGCRLPSSGPQAAPGNALRRPGGPTITARTSYVLELVPSTAARNRMPARAMRFIACPSGSCEAPPSWSIGGRCRHPRRSDSSFREKPPISSCQFIERGGILPQHLVTIGDLFCRVFLEHAPVLLLFQGGNRNAYERGGGQGEDQNDVRHDGLPRLLSMAVCRQGQCNGMSDGNA